MKVEPRVPEQTLLRHSVEFHDGPTDLVTRLTAIARARLERGEQLALALPAGAERAVLEAVGTAGVALLETGFPPGVASGQTTAVLRARELRTLVRSEPTVALLCAHDPALDGADGGYWTELDAALNVTLADLAIDVICLYPAFPLHLEVLDGAAANHPYLHTACGLRPNPDYRCPRVVLAGRPRSQPAMLGPPDVRLEFNSWDLHDVRKLVATSLTGLGFDAVRAEDVVLAVNEIATNAVEHGSARAEIQLWSTRDGLICEIHDSGGALDEPLPGLKAPHPAEPRGRGLWIARQLCDVLHVWHDGRGTHVRLHAGA